MKETFIIIGEGPTEYFFLTSLKDEFRTLQNIDPQYPKHTSMAELEMKIKKAIEQGYNHVYCMIDLDNKKEGKNKSDYVNLKKKYHGKHISKPKKGIDCHIEFFETERCTELFFIYYFKYTTKLYNHSNEVEADLANNVVTQRRRTSSEGILCISSSRSRADRSTMRSQMRRSLWPLPRTEDILSLSWEGCLRCWE